MAITELQCFWRAVRAANRMCLLDLHRAQELQSRARPSARLAAETRRLATASLRVFRPLERSLQAYQQVLRCHPRAKDSWQRLVVRRLAAIVPLCRESLVHDAYQGLVIALEEDLFSAALSFSSLEYGAISAAAPDGLPSLRVLTEALQAAQAARRRTGEARQQAAGRQAATCRSKLVTLLARDLSDEAIEAMTEATAADASLSGLRTLMAALVMHRRPSGG